MSKCEEEEEEKEDDRVEKLLKLDVVIPSLRCNVRKLDFMLGKLKVPKGKVWSEFAVRLSIDNASANLEGLEDLRQKYPYFHIVNRKKRNVLPSGASAARNDGAQDSNADWILFLDDDVIPRDNILQVYADSILEFLSSPGKVDIYGFVGLTEFNVPDTLFGLAVKSQGMISPFVVAKEKRLPVWAPTSNLVLRRDRSTFDETLPKSGGSEDVELCARIFQEKHGRPCFVSVPGAVASHNLWTPSATMRRAFRWGASSVDLQIRHENLTIRTYPDTIETILLWLLIWIVVSILRDASIALSRWWFAFAIAIVLTALHEVVIWVTRIMSHIRFNQYSLLSGGENGVRSTHGTQVANLIRVARSDGGFVFYLCLVGVAILATIIDSTFLLGKLYGVVTKRRGWICFSRNFDFTFGTEDRLPACLSFKDVVARIFLIPAVCILIGVGVV